MFAVCFSFFIERCWSVGEKEGGVGVGLRAINMCEVVMIEIVY